jgi:hypothetical protein
MIDVTFATVKWLRFRRNVSVDAQSIAQPMIPARRSAHRRRIRRCPPALRRLLHSRLLLIDPPVMAPAFFNIVLIHRRMNIDRLVVVVFILNKKTPKVLYQLLVSILLGNVCYPVNIPIQNLF